MKFIRFAIASAALAAAAPASAAVVVDGTPTGPNVNTWVNQAASQNFLVKFTLGAVTSITGLDIFTLNQFGAIGQAVRVRIRSDAAGSPSATNLFSFDDAIDTNTAFAGGGKIAGTDFAGINLAAGTYWFGVSGLTSELGWSSFNNGGPASNPNQRQLSGEAVGLTPGINDLGFRIRSEDMGAVPEPGTWLMMLLGFGAMGATMRHRRGQTTVKFA